VLVSGDGTARDQVSYGMQADGVSMGRLPDGTGGFQPLPYSPTPGSSNYLAELGTRLRLAEVLARSEPGPDWVELENVSAASLPLSGYTIDVTMPGQPLVSFALRPGTLLNAGQRMLVYFGTAPADFTPASGAQLFATRLPDQAGVLSLRDSLGHIVDRVEYGPQLLNQSVGRVSDGWALLSTASPGQANGAPAATDPGNGLRLNEWLAAGGGTNDFVEVYNPSAAAVDLGGWTLTDDPSINGSTNTHLAPLTFVGPRSFVRFHTDGEPESGLDHTAFRLDSLGETIRLLNRSSTVIDTIDFLVQVNETSEGRFPDGSSVLVRLAEPTPAAPNIYRMADVDADGIDDRWELQHGLNPNSAADAELDGDNDGVSNLNEFLSGTDPRDGTSALRLVVAGVSSGGVRLAFQTQAGRAYVAEYSDDVSSASWTTLTLVPAAAATGEVVITDATPVTERPTRFYRIAAPR
jgi:hypothetical protein